LVEQCLAAREHASAYYHAAWLYWLAPKEQAEAGFAYVADRRLRDRARAAGPDGAVSIVVGAVTARQQLVDACLRGTIATQTSFLQREVSQLLAEAERNAACWRRAIPWCERPSPICLSRSTMRSDSRVDPGAVASG